MTAAQTCAALTTDGVNFVDKDDGGHRLFGFFKQVAHAGSADADVHFDKVRAGDRVERHACFPGAGTRQQGLAGTRRSHQQNAVGNARAERVELAGGFQELNDLLQLRLFLVRTRNIGKGRLALVFLLVLDLGAPNVHNAAAGTAAVHRHKHQNDHTQHGGVDDNLRPREAGALGDIIVDHGLVGVGGVVGVNIRINDLAVVKDAVVRQLIGHMHGAAVLGQSVAFAAGQPGQQPAGGSRRGGFLLRKLYLAFLQPHFEAGGVQIQPEGRDLIVAEIIPHGGIVNVLRCRCRHKRRKRHEKQCQHHKHCCQNNAVKFRLVLQEINS